MQFVLGVLPVAPVERMMSVRAAVGIIEKFPQKCSAWLEPKVTQSRYLGGDFGPELRGQLFRGFAFR